MRKVGILESAVAEEARLDFDRVTDPIAPRSRV